MREPSFKSKDIIVLVVSKDTGKDAWWYVKCKNRIKAEMLKAICVKKSRELIPLAEYGEIIFCGWGKNPPQEIIEKVENIYL